MARKNKFKQQDTTAEAPTLTSQISEPAEMTRIPATTVTATTTATAAPATKKRKNGPGSDEAAKAHIRRKLSASEGPSPDTQGPSAPPAARAGSANATSGASRLVQQPARPGAATRAAPEIAAGPVLPPDLASLADKYDVHHVNIVSSSEMTAKVKHIHEKLFNGFDLAKPAQKPGIVALTAKSKVGNKLIGILEIVKRELDGKKLRWFQYTGVSGRIEALTQAMALTSVDKQRLHKPSVGGGKALKDWNAVADVEMEEDAVEHDVIDLVDDEDEEDAFEPVKEHQKVRKVPVITIYISRVPVPELKKRYSEQVSATTLPPLYT